MEPFPHHVFVCTQQRIEDKRYCTEHGSERILFELERLLIQAGIQDQVQVTPCGCLGLCADGPNLVVYPGGIWYSGVGLGDMEEIVRSHLAEGRPVQRLMRQDEDRMREEILLEQSRTRSIKAAQEEAGVISERLRRLASDFWASRAFLTAVELDLFSAIDEACSAVEAAERMGTDPRATEMLLNALTAIGLLHKREGRFSNTQDTGRYLRRGLPDDARAALMNRVHMWDSWSTLTDCVREGSALSVNHVSPSFTQAYVASTHRIAALAAPALVAALDLPEVRRVLDVGGGSGAYSVAVLRAFPGATAELVDLPHVLHLAPRYIREARMEDRITLRAADFTVDPLGSGFDAVLLSYVMHLLAAEPNKRLLVKAFEALVTGGRVVINDYVLNAEKNLPRAAALYALHMLVSTRGGNVYSFDEYRDWLSAAGFVDVRKVPLAGPTDVIMARRQ